MKKIAYVMLLAAILIAPVFSQKQPDLQGLKLIGENPSEKLKNISGITFHEGLLWCLVFNARERNTGYHATFNPRTAQWTFIENEKAQRAILAVSQPFNSPAGFVFVGKKLWVSGSYGKSFGVIDTEKWEVEKTYRQMVRPDLVNTNSQSYADLTYDGSNIWIAWHLYDYNLPAAQVQQLLKINPENGEVVEKFPLPVGSRPTPDHGLTFDGETLWHIKGRQLSKIGLDGKVLTQFTLKQSITPSGLAWDGGSLWISEASGKLWNLPFN